MPADIADGSGGTFAACLLVDVNHDGFPNLVLGAIQGPSAGQGIPNELLLNDRTGRFMRDRRFALPPKLLDPSSTVAMPRSAPVSLSVLASSGLYGSMRSISAAMAGPIWWCILTAPRPATRSASS